MDANPAPRDSTSFQEFVRTLLVYRWLWLGSALTCALTAGLVTLVLTPRYTAECLVLVEPGKLNLTEFKDVYDPATLQSGAPGEQFARTQEALLLSDPILEKVFVRFGFAEMEPFRDAADPIHLFRDRFAVEPVPKTRLARVTFTWRDPELAARALHHLVKTYIEEYRRRRLGITAEGLALLRTKAAELRPEVEAKARALQEFLAAHKTVSFEEGQDVVQARLRELSTRLSQVVAERLEAQSRYETMRKALAGGGGPGSVPEATASPTIRELRLNLARITQQLQDLRGRLGRRHPEVVRLVAQERVLREELQAEVQRIVQAAAAEFERLKREEQALREAVAEQERQVLERKRLAVQYNLLKNAYESANESYRAVIKRIDEVEIAGATGTKEENLFVVAPPRVPSSPSYPRRKQAMVLAGLGGLFLGWGLAFLLHLLDRTLKTTEDVETALSLPVLGHVPAVRGRAMPEREAALHPSGAFAEAFRSLRTALLLARAGGPPQCLVVSSAAPGEGKDLISVNLALSLARSARRVVLIDGDLRRPRLHRLWAGAGRQGLSMYLAGSTGGAEELLRATDQEGLFFLPAGPTPPNPLELLSSDRLQRLLQELRDRFDAVVINSPPLMPVTDAVVLGRAADGVVLVVRAFATRREEAQRSVALLRRAEVPVLGTILNLVDVPRPVEGYYGYGYSYRYDAGATEGRVETPVKGVVARA